MPLAIAMQNAPTVASAMDYASHYMFVHSPGLVLTLHQGSRSVRILMLQQRDVLRTTSSVAKL